MQIRVHLMSPKEDYPQIKYNLNVSKDSVQKTPSVISLLFARYKISLSVGLKKTDLEKSPILF